MKLRFSILIGVLFWVIFCPNSQVFAEETADSLRVFSQERMDSMRSLDVYNYLDFEVREQNWLQRQWHTFKQFLRASFGESSGLVLNVLYILIALLAVGMLVNVFAKAQGIRIFGRKERNIQIDIEDLGEVKNTQDFERLLDNAKIDKEWRRAIQLLYLRTLWTLNENGHIDIEKYKSNRVYIEEIKKEDTRAKFKNLAQYFEWVWYGNHDISQEYFLSIEKEFDLFLSDIQTKNYP